MAGSMGRFLAVFTLLAMHERGAAFSCYFGSNDFGVQEKPTTCSAWMDACVTFKITTPTKTGTGYGCTSQQNCQNPALNKVYLESQMMLQGLYTATAGNMVCCTVDNCNRAGAAAATHRVVVSMLSSPHLFFPISLLLSHFFV